ncbi:non-ribosomal peptide synthetase [uncultured Xanthomonas sp.]|uniref:non-ribosomal peptide synthetase n=1 Tax=uncultured Xanthomonas sp. TaxID=152831 RepID=UPI0025D67E1A|nr:non-ribosomal peptide synthetase [uncultured Xanthomonas sp.]
MTMDLLNEAGEAGVVLFLSNGKLKLRANRGAVSDELRQRILASKAELIALLTELDGVRREDGRDVIMPGLQREGRVPLSLQQQRLWVNETLHPGTAEYSIPAAYRVRGAFSIEAAQAALDAVMARHAVLRSSFHQDDEQIHQRSHEGLQATIARHDLRGLVTADHEAAVARIIAADAGTPFDLAQPPLLRAAWMALAADEGVLYFNLHHIVFDGWSMDILLREFVAFYRERTQGVPHGLLPLSIQYADYAIWQRQRQNQERVEEQLGHWTQALAGAPLEHALPLDHPRPRQRRHVGARVDGRIPATQLARLEALAARLDVTLFMLLHGALALVLARQGAEPDVVIGTPVANRGSAQLDELIGYFINTLVLRVSCHESQTVADYFRHVREVNLGAQTWQDVPFDLLIERLEVPRSSAYSPLFQIMLSLDNTSRTADSGGVLAVEPLSTGVIQAKYDLTLYAAVDQQGLQLGWVYDTALFSAGTVERLCGQLEALLASLPGELLECPLAALDWLKPAERAELEGGMVGDSVAVDHALLPDLRVAQFARQTPAAVALVDGASSRSYAWLDAEIDSLAARLIAHGAASQDNVGIAMPPSSAMVVAVLACLRIGACYVPIDPAAAQSSIDHIIGDSGLRLLLTLSTLPDFTRATGVAACYVDEPDDAAGASSAASLPAVAAAPDDLAYILYTSGSTGQPKGVAITRAGLCNYLGHCLRTYANEDIEEAVVSSPLTFDATITTLFTPLISGCALRIVAARHEDLAWTLGDLMLGDRVRRLFKLTPAHLDLLARYWEEHGEQRQGLVPMQLVIGGEQLLRKTLAPLLERLAAGSVFVNEYGPTETVVGCCVYTVRSLADLQAATAAVPIGRPIQNTRLLVLDDQRLVPHGATGELFIAGAGVARGYLNRDALQARHFVVRDVAGTPQRFYRTGDLVRRNNAGELEFKGRNDEQIKLRGHRIEPAEIEACLCAYPGIREAAVVLSRQTTPPLLVACLVADLGDAQEAALQASLRDWCQARLSAVSIPAAFRLVPRLPTTSNGKVDRQALAALPVHLQPATSYRAPQTPVERSLCALLGALLNRERVGLDDNFFALGGDSILAIQLVSRARKAGLRVSTQQIFEHQTVAALARVAATTAAHAVGAQTSAAPFALTPIQQWFVRAQPETADHYNQSLLLEAPDALDPARLAAIVEALLRRHDGLRTRFAREGGVWRARVTAFDPSQVADSVVVEPLPEGVDARRRFIAARGEHHQASLRLDRGPVFKTVLFSGAQASRILIIAHHMVVDGVSWRVLLEDFDRAWQQCLDGSEVALGAGGTSYQYWSQLLGRLAAEGAFAGERDYWRGQAAGAGFDYREHLPDRTPTMQSMRQVLVELSDEETSALLTYANAPYATRTLELLLASVYLGLAPRAGTTSFSVALEGHGREDLETGLDLSETLGWFTSIHPHVLSGDTTDPGATLRSIKDNLRAVPRGGIGFGVLKYLVADAALQQAHGAEQLIFNYLGQLDAGGEATSAFGLANEAAGSESAPTAPRMHRLSIAAFVLGGRMRLTLDYSEHEFGAATAAAMLDGIAAATRMLLAHCGAQRRQVRTPADFPLASLDAATLERLQQADEIDALYPSTPAQRSMLAANWLDRTAYVVQLYPLLRGPLDPEIFRRAWQGVVAAHAVLRTRFVGEGEDQHQLVRRNAQAEVAVVDLTGLDEHTQQFRFDTLCERDMRSGFDGSEPMLHRMTVIRMAADRHRLLFTCHHSIMDGWSTALILNELLDNVKCLGQGGTLAPRSTPDYGSYVAWLLRQDAAAAVASWQAHLDQASPSMLKLPRAEASDTPRHALLQEVVDADTTRRIRAFARKHGVTLNTVVQFAWALVLKAYCGTADVVFGAVVSGRPEAVDNVDRMVGQFINTIPVRVRLDRGAVGAQLDALQRSFQQLNAQSFLAYSEIKRYAGAIGDTALFQTLIDFKNYPVNEHATDADVHGDALSVETTEGHGTNSFDISLIVGVYEAMMFNCSYRGDLYAQAHVEQMLSYLSSVLGMLVQGRAVADIAPPIALSTPFATAGEPVLPLLQGFDRAVAATPERAALSCGEVTVSFAALDAQANRIARLLQAQGVSPDQPVGVMAQRGIALVAAVLGIFKAGAAYVPIDLAYPAQRKRFIVEDSGLRQLLCDRASEFLDLQGVAQHRIDAPEALATYAASAVEAPRHAASDLAYVIYTSGSTGTPKGVMVEYGNLRNLMAGMRTQGFDGQGCWAEVASFSFDASVQGLCHLLQGGHLVVLTDEEKVDAASVRARILEHGVTVADCTPTLASAWLEQGLDDVLPQLVVGGEAVPPALWARLAAYGLRGRGHFNAYGPTETTVNASMARIAGDTPYIGWCLHNVHGLVLDADMAPCPVGVAGELYIGGHGVVRGYAGNPSLTAARFVTDTLSGRGGRLYRTGDEVRRRLDGAFEYLGRLDDQVKVNGYRIELDEVANALQRHALVDAAMVFAARATDGRQRLVACARAVPSVDPRNLVPALSAWLQQQLPAFMQPHLFAVVSQWPMTSNGKVDRDALQAAARPVQAPEEAGSTVAAPAEQLLCTLFASVLGVQEVAPDEDFYALGGDSILAIRMVAKAAREGMVFTVRQLTAHPTPRRLATVCGGAAVTRQAATAQAQETLCALFASVLGREHVGPNENFYALGGDSILAIRLVAKAGKAGIRFSVRQLAQQPTPRALAAVCDSAAATQQRTAVTGEQPLLPIHHEVIVEQLAAGLTVFDHFNGGSLFGLPPGLHASSVRDIYDALLSRHDALRLAFRLDAPAPSAVYLEPAAPVFAQATAVEHVAGNAADVAAAVKAICVRHQHALRLADGGLLRLVLIRAPDVDRLLLLGHHAILDVVSWHLLVADLGEAVQQCLRGEPVRLAPSASTYQAWGRHLLACARSGRFAGELGYWARQLATASLAPVLAPDAPAADIGHRRHQPLRLDAVSTAALLAAGGAHAGADINAILLTALYRGLTAWRGGGGFRILLESHGRHSDETGLDLSQTVGWFTQSYPFLMAFEAGDLQQDLATVRAQLAAVPHDGLGYGVLRFLERAPALCDPEMHAPFQVLFNYLGQFNSMVADAGVLRFLQEDIGPSASERMPLSAAMGFQGGVYGGQLAMNIEFDARHFSGEDMQRLADLIHGQLMRIVGNPTARVAEVADSAIN